MIDGSTVHHVPASEPIVVLDHVHRVYGTGDSAVHAIRDVSLALAGGRFHAILGPSGSGKSTLLHLAAALDQPTSGRVSVLGNDVAQLDDASLARLRRRSIGLVFQFFNLVPSLTVEENVLLPILLDRDATAADRERLTRLLDRVGIAARKKHRPEELSGGERQRAAIVRALLPAPPLLLADEPTGSLDSKTGESITRLLKDLAHDDGVCIVAVTHDLRVADQADEVIRLEDGRVIDVAARAADVTGRA